MVISRKLWDGVEDWWRLASRFGPTHTQQDGRLETRLRVRVKFAKNVKKKKKRFGLKGFKGLRSSV